MGNYALLLAFAAAALLIVIAVVIAIIRTPYFLARAAMAGMLFLSVAAIVGMVLFAGRSVASEVSRPMTESGGEKTEATTDYAYDIGEPKENIDETDITDFCNEVKDNVMLWAHSDPFVAERTSAKDLLTNYVFMNYINDGLFDTRFDFSAEYVPDPHGVTDMYGDTMVICRYNAADVDWVLKALFNKDIERFGWEDQSSGHYYEGEYFYRRASEMYAGWGGWYEVNEMDFTYEKAGENTYRVTLNLTMRWRDEPSEERVWEFEAVPMESRDMGTYWRILSFTQK